LITNINKVAYLAGSEGGRTTMETTNVYDTNGDIVVCECGSVHFKRANEHIIPSYNDWDIYTGEFHAWMKCVNCGAWKTQEYITPVKGDKYIDNDTGEEVVV
jgi:hypothetical protein